MAALPPRRGAAGGARGRGIVSSGDKEPDPGMPSFFAAALLPQGPARLRFPWDLLAIAREGLGIFRPPQFGQSLYNDSCRFCCAQRTSRRRLGRLDLSLAPLSQGHSTIMRSASASLFKCSNKIASLLLLLFLLIHPASGAHVVRSAPSLRGTQAIPVSTPTSTCVCLREALPCPAQPQPSLTFVMWVYPA
jgi:hypothetical protein